MAKTKSWGDLRLGLTSLAAVVAGAVLILVFGRVGTLHGKTFRLYVTTDGARGVIRGTEVWLDGQKVGRVSSVAFRPPTVNPSERLVLVLRVLDKARLRIRKDSRAQIRSGLTILGERVVSLNSGSNTQPGVVDGDTIHSGQQIDLEGITSDAALASREFPGILANVKLLTAQLRTAQGTLAAFGVEHGPQFDRLQSKTERLFAMLGDTAGSIGLARRDLESGRLNLSDRASRAMAQVDSIRALLSSNSHSLGRFRRDSTLRGELERMRTELERVQELASSPLGTIGRFRADSALIRAIARDRALVDSVFLDMKKHPTRYIAF